MEKGNVINIIYERQTSCRKSWKLKSTHFRRTENNWKRKQSVIPRT